jgi:hypothetical protein
MPHLTDLAVDALPIVRTACILTAATCRILLAHLTTVANVRHGATAPAENSTACETPTAIEPPRRHTRLSCALRATLHTSRVAAAFATILSWLHLTVDS